MTHLLNCALSTTLLSIFLLWFLAVHFRHDRHLLSFFILLQPSGSFRLSSKAQYSPVNGKSPV